MSDNNLSHMNPLSQPLPPPQPNAHSTQRIAPKSTAKRYIAAGLSNSQDLILFFVKIR